jgi:hypothetical protein
MSARWGKTIDAAIGADRPNSGSEPHVGSPHGRARKRRISGEDIYLLATVSIGLGLLLGMAVVILTWG